MEQLSIQASTREKGSKVLQKVRGQNEIPAVLYGHGIKNTLLKLKYKDFEKIYKKAGENVLVDLMIDDKKTTKVLVYDLQKDALTDAIIHVDFYQVKMDEKLQTEVPIKIIGLAPAIKTFGAILITAKEALKVECYPQDLIQEIEVDVSELKKIDDSIRIAKIKVPSTIKVLDNPNETVVLVSAPRSEEELSALNETVTEDVDKVEIEKAKPAEEEGADEKTETKAEKK